MNDDETSKGDCGSLPDEGMVPTSTGFRAADSWEMPSRRRAKKGRTIGGPTAGETAARFNAEFPVGSIVTYFETLPDGPSKKTIIRDPAFVAASGDPVVFVRDVRGYVSVWHIQEFLVGKAIP